MHTHRYMRKATLLILLLQLCWCSCQSQHTTTATTSLTARVLKDSLFIPWEILYGPDDHIWFTQKNGYICRIDTSGLHTDTLYHEAMVYAHREAGMLGMALHPSFATQPYVYVAFTYQNAMGAIRERIQRLTYSSATNTLSSPMVLLDSIRGNVYHNGCRLLVVEDKLFITLGEATDTSLAQNMSTVNGKILRLNLDGTIPADNPIPGSPIWSVGHRNPQGLTYANGRLYSSEHGPDTDDEVNIIMKGRNYGWPRVHGYCDEAWETAFCSTANVAEPIQAWTPTIAVCGIEYYDNPHFPTLQNSLLMTTLKDRHLYRLALNSTYDAITSVSLVDDVNFGRLRDICVAPNGRIYLSTSNSNPDNTGPQVDRIIELSNPEAGGSTSVSVYPSPAHDFIYVSVPVAYTTLQYTIFDMAGRVAARGSMPALRPRLTIADLATGLYRAVFTTDRGGRWASFIVRE